MADETRPQTDAGEGKRGTGKRALAWLEGAQKRKEALVLTGAGAVVAFALYKRHTSPKGAQQGATAGTTTKTGPYPVPTADTTANDLYNSLFDNLIQQLRDQSQGAGNPSGATAPPPTPPGLPPSSTQPSGGGGTAPPVVTPPPAPPAPAPYTFTPPSTLAGIGAETQDVASAFGVTPNQGYVTIPRTINGNPSGWALSDPRLAAEYADLVRRGQIKSA